MNPLNISLDNQAVRARPEGLRRATVDGNRLLLETSGASACVTAVAEGIVRVNWLPPGDWMNEPTSYAEATESAGPAPRWLLKRRGCEAGFGGLRVRWTTGSLRLVFCDERGEFLRESPQAGPAYLERGAQLGWTVGRREAVFGLGQNAFASLNRVGQRRHMAANHRGHAGGDIPIPLWVSSRGYGVLVDNPNVGEFDLSRRGRIVFRAAGGYPSYYVLAGGGALDVLERYVALTGRPPMPPKWVFGAMFSRIPGTRHAGYRSAKELVALAREFRRRRIPCDALILDYQWNALIGDYDWDARAFKRARDWIGRLHKLGTRTMVQLKPAVNVRSRRFRELSSGGHLLRRADGTIHTTNYHQGRSAYLDVFQPRTRDWLGKALAARTGEGVAAWWTDEGDWLGYMAHAGRDLERDSATLRNLFNNRWCQAIYEGQRSRSDRRVFNITRAGWAGIQRYGTAVWSGDVSTTWKGLESQIQMGLNAGLSGIPFWTSDGGGFLEKDPTPELYIRWAQFAALCPIARFHGCGPREPWHYGARAERIVRRFLELRRRLLPYIYSAARQAHLRGAPMMRPVDECLVNGAAGSGESACYFFGPSLLVVPVTWPLRSSRPRTRAMARLPAGEWIDFWSGRRHRGPVEVAIEPTLEHIPVFIRTPAILPMLADAQTQRGRDRGAIELHLYPDASNGTWSAAFALYDDDGRTYAYEQGDYCEVAFSFSSFAVGRITLDIDTPPRRAPRKGPDAWSDLLRLCLHSDGEKIHRPGQIEKARWVNERQGDREPPVIRPASGRSRVVWKFPDRA